MRRLTIIMLIMTLGLAACGAPPTQRAAPTSSNSSQGGAPTTEPSTDVPVPTLEPTTAYTPGPTTDFSAYLLTQAYAAYTPQASATELPTTPFPATQTPVIGTSSGGLAATAAPTQPPAPVSLILQEPTQIPTSYITADCKIRDIGDCTSSMSSGITVFLQYTFSVAGQKYSWGNAAVTTTKDGQQYAWQLVGNALLKKQPDATKNEMNTMTPGGTAIFNAGLGNLQPGHYTARLAICPNTPDLCSAGVGWQNVGGQAVNFVITQ